MIKKLTAHVFVCMNEREKGNPRGCCKTKGSEAVLNALKSETAKAGLQTEIRIQKAGCLDTCEEGISIVVYPENVWYGKVTEGDAREIIQSHLKSGKIVERLLMPGK